MKKQMIAVILLIGLSNATMLPNVMRHVHCLFKPSKPQQCSKKEIQAARAWLGKNSLRALGALLLAAGATATTIFAVKQVKKKQAQQKQLVTQKKPFVAEGPKRHFEQEKEQYQKEKKERLEQKETWEKIQKKMDPHAELRKQVAKIMKEYMEPGITAIVTVEGPTLKIFMITKKMPGFVAQKIINQISAINNDITKLSVGSHWEMEDKEYRPL